MFANTIRALVVSLPMLLLVGAAPALAGDRGDHRDERIARAVFHSLLFATHAIAHDGRHGHRPLFVHVHDRHCGHARHVSRHFVYRHDHGRRHGHRDRHARFERRTARH